MTSSINSAAPASALTKMGVSPVNALEKYNINSSEQTRISLDKPQVRPPSVTDLPKPDLLTNRGTKLDVSA